MFNDKLQEAFKRLSEQYDQFICAKINEFIKKYEKEYSFSHQEVFETMLTNNNKMYTISSDYELIDKLDDEIERLNKEIERNMYIK